MVSETEGICPYRDDALMSMAIALIADIQAISRLSTPSWIR
jgi:hypothetical protein